MPGALGLTAHPYVFVLDKHGHPLQPCHPARARQLLAKGRAVVAHLTPFVIRLRDRTIQGSVVPGVEVGIDPGSKATGIAVFTTSTSPQPPAGLESAPARRGVYGIELGHRGGLIRDRLTRRAAFRRRRRSTDLRYRKPRFNNRTRPEGWLPPSLQHRVDTTRSWVDRLARWAPVRAIHLERTAFDTQLLENPDIAGVEYQQGTLAGTGLVVHVATSGRTKWNRTRSKLPKSHTLDALCVGQLDTVGQVPDRVLVVAATGRGSYQRTTPDRYGFPRLQRARAKRIHGFVTGDLVRAVVPAGRHTGTHVGRVAVRTSGRFNLRTQSGLVQGVHHRHVKLLQRADGYGYTWKGEGACSSA